MNKSLFLTAALIALVVLSIPIAMSMLPQVTVSDASLTNAYIDMAVIAALVFTINSHAVRRRTFHHIATAYVQTKRVLLALYNEPCHVVEGRHARAADRY